MNMYTTRDEAGVLIVTFTDASGLNDFRNTPLRDSLFELVEGRPSPPRAALDMRKIDYLSSSGVAVLIGLKRRVETKEGKIALFGLQPPVHDLLKIMKLDRYLAIADDETQAVSQLHPASSV